MLNLTATTCLRRPTLHFVELVYLWITVKRPQPTGGWLSCLRDTISPELLLRLSMPMSKGKAPCNISIMGIGAFPNLPCPDASQTQDDCLVLVARQTAQIGVPLLYRMSHDAGRLRPRYSLGALQRKHMRRLMTTLLVGGTIDFVQNWSSRKSIHGPPKKPRSQLEGSAVDPPRPDHPRTKKEQPQPLARSTHKISVWEDATRWYQVRLAGSSF